MDLAHAHDRFATKILATVTVLALTITFATRVRRDAPYMMVDELVTKRFGDSFGHVIRVHGWLRVGSIEHAGDDHRFVLTAKGAALRVHYRGEWPARIRDQSEVVVRGTLTFDDDGWLLEASEMQWRCSIKYGDDNNRLDTVFK
jgi:cytochrome c-type biogenesis protein CcmE